MPPPPDDHPAPLSENPFAPPDIDKMRRRCFAILHECGLEDRADRCDLASFVLGRKIRSWTEFSTVDWRRMTDGLVCWYGITELRKQKGLPR